MTLPKRGEVWWADLGEPRGSEPGLRRPVLVVQHDQLTTSRLNTVMVAPLTSNVKRAAASGNVLVSRHQSGLSLESVVLACQLETLDKVFFEEKIGNLGDAAMTRVDRALCLNLALRAGGGV